MDLEITLAVCLSKTLNVIDVEILVHLAHVLLGLDASEQSLTPTKSNKCKCRTQQKILKLKTYSTHR